MSPRANDVWWRATQPQFTDKMINFLNNDLYQGKIVNDFYQNLIVKQWWEGNIRPALMQMTAQLIAAEVEMTGAVGAMLDGQVANEYQLRLQELQARSFRDYTPSEGLCRLGTGVRSLATADAKAGLTKIVLAELAEDRMMSTRGGGTEDSTRMDREGRFDAFRRLYCDPGDNNGQMAKVCYQAGKPISVPARFNKDIDFVRTIDAAPTLNLDFSDGVLTDDEQDVLALASNLYGHEVFSHFQSELFKDDPDDPNDQSVLDLRQVVALHSVAQNSFNAITAMRAKGGADSSAYLTSVLQEMGFSDTEAKRYVAGSSNAPSYYAQMEILTKKLYQNPNFYANLMDKPANVKRQLAAMKGFELMQNRDIFESLQRQEMLISLMLEMEVREAQSAVEREIEKRK